MSGNELEGLTLIEICVTFLCAQSRREKRGRGERERKKRDRKIERSEIPADDSCLSHQAN